MHERRKKHIAKQHEVLHKERSWNFKSGQPAVTMRTRKSQEKCAYSNASHYDPSKQICLFYIRDGIYKKNSSGSKKSSMKKIVVAEATTFLSQP